jgi:hypothetical protein
MSTGSNMQMSDECHSYVILTRRGQNKGFGDLGFLKSTCVSLILLFIMLQVFPVPARTA